MMIQKREGYVEAFNPLKVRNAVVKALEESGEGDDTLSPADAVTKKVVEVLQTQEVVVVPTVEMVQDIVEDALMDLGLKQTAKLFIKYRQQRTEIRNKGWQMDDLQKTIWEKKYRHGNETFDQWIERVSGGNEKVGKLIKQKKFIFAGRILAHRGLTDKKVTYSNCYVVAPPEDNLESIFETAKELARTYSYGGGCGVDISKLRPKGAKVNNSAKETSGATSFMQLFDLTTDLIGQNGRRGALMISLADSHPDIEDFIDIKTTEGAITKANISIMVSDDFMEAVENDKQWRLHWEGEDGLVIERFVNAKELYMKNCQNNWDWAEAGMLYWDTIKEWHMMNKHPEHSFAGVNPCAEEPLMAGGSCLLGSMNLSEFVVHPFTDQAYFDYDKFKEAVYIAVIGLNEVLEEGLKLHPLESQRTNARDWKQIGLGIMGLADMLIKLGIPYGSEESLKLSSEIGQNMFNYAVQSSSKIAKYNGSFPKFNLNYLMQSNFFVFNAFEETVEMVKENGLRNSQILTIAPTGSISTMWGISGGIEPIFATHYDRKTESLHGGTVVYKVYTPIVAEYMEKTGCKELPKDLFKTAHDIHWKERVKMQGHWQECIDASISSTVNLPKEATVEEVGELFLMAWEYGLKGITIFRDGCKRTGILTIETDADQEETVEEPVEQIETIVCADCGMQLEVFSGGCSICMNCGWSPCS